MKSMAKFLTIAVLLSLAVFPLFAEPVADMTGKRLTSGGNVAGKTYELVLLHTNDHHGSILPNGGKGGLAEVAAYVKAVKATNAQVLLVDAGDFNTGSALSNMFAAEPDILGYNIMGYDAGIFGNHEFDGNQEKLLKQIGLAKFPFVSSNIKTPDGKYLGGNQYLIKKYDGFTVGIFGITTLRTKIIASPDKSLTFIDEIQAAREVVNILRNREKVDIVIGVSHIGNVKEAPDHVISPELAAAVPGIDIIVDGHSHTYMEAPIKVGSTWIVSANEWGKYVGHGKLTVQNGKLLNFAWTPIAIEPDQEVVKMLAPYIKKANESLKEVVGEAAEEFVFGNRLTRYQETAIGNGICDANVWYFRTVYNQDIDFAFHNGGNIRTGIPKGPVTQEQILTVLPFENYLYIVSLKGSDILELFKFIGTIAQGAGGFPQFSGEVRYTIDKTEGNGVVKNLTIGGAPVDPNKTYRFCTNDYLLGGGDGYVALTKSENPFNTSLLLSYVVVEAIKSLDGPVSPETDGRLTVIGGVTP
ncbi:multifunctional 2',3'-cyclic-nucleotide 2'-phosphodiesterase/5'-nucleotidase/3'-nucleotidase [Spirochaetia bacterium]|nr:multifunctional 2',3'-cyclic-nucleotide 2'-phosphodiesterase/5'-nucleotidase/3'-nucleotidase [Spirochaetia bacterium]